MKINFNFGKDGFKKSNIIIVGIFFSLLIFLLSNLSGISESKLWDLLDEIQREYFPQTELNEVIIQDDEKLQRRIERDVDKAIREYEDLTGDSGEVKIPSPRFIEEPGDSSLGGPMRLCAPWVDDCPKE